MKPLGGWALGLCSALTYDLLYAPIAVTVLFSFNAPQGRFNLVWQGFTLENWLHPLRDRALKMPSSPASPWPWPQLVWRSFWVA
jgi:ABC-type spermidine/putrescine transport system permease subunit II